MALLALGAFAALAPPASAETLYDALTRAVRDNPALGAQRRGAAAAGEAIAQARSKYFPKVSASADAGYNALGGQFDVFGSPSSASLVTRPHGYGLQATQTLFNGFQTANSVLLAGSQGLGAEQALQVLEQSTLFDAVSAYTAVLRDRDLVALNESSVAFSRQQMAQVEARHGFGDVTAAEVAQAKARLASGQLKLQAAKQQLDESGILYRQIVGIDPAKQMTPPLPVDRLVPQGFDKAMQLALRDHPSVQAAQSAIAAANAQVDIVKGAFMPTVSLTAGVSKRYDSSVPGDTSLDRSIVGQIAFPIFDGGQTTSQSRQAKEVAGQRGLEGDAAREQVRATLAASWGRLQTAKAEIVTVGAQFEAARLGLSATTEQYAYGQKTLTDVFYAQQDMLDAAANAISVRRDRIVAAYGVVRATGQLTLARLGADLDDRSKAARFVAFPQLSSPKLSPLFGPGVPLDAPWPPCSRDCPRGLDFVGLRPGMDAPIDVQVGGLRLRHAVLAEESGEGPPAAQFELSALLR